MRSKNKADETDERNNKNQNKSAREQRITIRKGLPTIHPNTRAHTSDDLTNASVYRIVTYNAQKLSNFIEFHGRSLCVRFRPLSR